MLYTMVCRIDEILSIKVGNLIFDSVKPHVMAIGKGRKSRTVYIMSRTVSILKEHILVEHSKTPNPDASLLFSHSKGLFSKVSMTNNIVQKIDTTAARTVKPVWKQSGKLKDIFWIKK